MISPREKLFIWFVYCVCALFLQIIKDINRQYAADIDEEQFVLTVLDSKVATNVHSTKESTSLRGASDQQVDTRVTFILFEYAVDSNSASTNGASSSLSSKGSSSSVQGLVKNDSKTPSSAAISSNNNKKTQNFECDGPAREPTKAENGTVKDKKAKKGWLGSQRTPGTEAEVVNWLHK